MSIVYTTSADQSYTGYFTALGAMETIRSRLLYLAGQSSGVDAEVLRLAADFVGRLAARAVDAARQGDWATIAKLFNVAKGVARSVTGALGKTDEVLSQALQVTV